MPLPWLVSAWACSPWAAEPAREAAVATDDFGVPDPIGSQDWLPDPDVAIDDAEASAADWHAQLTADWPDVSTLIDPESRVTKDDDSRVVDFLASLGRKPRARIECFDRAEYQLYLAEYRTSNNPVSDDRSILVLREIREGGRVSDRLELDKMVQAVDQIKSSLSARVPLLIGLRLRDYDPRPNDWDSTPEIEPTNHYVVAVGAGVDPIGHYVSYFDYSSPFGSHTRLYLGPSMLMENSTGRKTLSEVRSSRPR